MADSPSELSAASALGLAIASFSLAGLMVAAPSGSHTNPGADSARGVGSLRALVILVLLSVACGVASMGCATAMPSPLANPSPPAALGRAERAVMWMPMPAEKVGYIPECTMAVVSARRGDPEVLANLLLAEGLAAAHASPVERVDPAALDAVLEGARAPNQLRAVPHDGGEIYGGLVMHTSVCDMSDSHPRGVCVLERRSADLTWRLSWFEMDSAPRGIAEGRCRELGGAWTAEAPGTH